MYTKKEVIYKEKTKNLCPYFPVRSPFIINNQM